MQKRMMLSMAAGALALAGTLFAGGFYLQLGNPDANPKAQKLGAVLVVKATGCHDPATATLTAKAIGTVNGQRREIPVDVKPLGGPGEFAITQQWPKEGRWVIELVGRNGEQFTNTLVPAGPDGVDRAHAKFNMKQFAAADVEELLNP
jgi:hypothetical protein